jgi:hypothetical protein
MKNKARTNHEPENIKDMGGKLPPFVSGLMMPAS